MKIRIYFLYFDSVLTITDHRLCGGRDERERERERERKRETERDIVREIVKEKGRK